MRQPDSPALPGKGSALSIAFTPAILGLHTATLTIASDDLENAVYTFAIQGRGVTPTPALTVLQKPKAFPVTQIGKKSRTQTLRVTNVGGSPLTGLRVSASGKARRDFLLTQPGLKTLAPGASTTFKATFRPKAKGARKATLEVRSNAPLAKAALSGKGKAKPKK